MKVAVCDDELQVLEELSSFLDLYCKEYHREIEYELFQSPIELFAKMEQGRCYDVLFLDILMKGDNGIDVARELRKQDENVKIIFLTSSSEYAVQSYTVGAFFYQLKPIQKENLTELMEKIFSEWVKEQSAYFIVKCKTGVHRIDVQQLEYCEVVNRSLVFYLQNGCELKSNISIQEVEDTLARFGCFVRPHRSYLINMRFIESISVKCINMTCKARIPIPHGKYTQIKDCYLEYAFENMGRMV